MADKKGLGRKIINAYLRAFGRFESQIQALQRQIDELESRYADSRQRLYDSLVDRLGGKPQAIAALRERYKQAGKCAYHVESEDPCRVRGDDINCDICGEFLYRKD